MNAKPKDAKAIFVDLIANVPQGEWDAQLERICDGDATLQRRVGSLLDAHARTGSFLDDPAIAADLTIDHQGESPGATIGPYRLLEAIGEGGMGVVYVAEQHEPVRRRVALKVIKPGMDTRQVLARFESERQALAMMDHPNIARVFDAGASESGRPYFVMELVKGVPITVYCDQARLSIPERLELFVLVCRAVQHAHQKGVIHRDLKPSNILVTVIDGAAVPKVIDFGIAKTTGGPLTERTIYTGFAQLVGTPLYMSPEQAALSGVDVDTRSDIYALGVLLYELLTGTTPIDRETLHKAAYDEIRRVIREQDPPTPSTRLSTLGESLSTISANRQADARKLGRTMRGELDWIVMKSLEKDRSRRYETANDFAADVTRHLTNQPVEACPPSARYRFAKYARRNRTTLATVGAFALLLIAATAVSIGLALRADRQRVRAQDREQMAIDAVKRFGDVVRETPELKNNPSLAKLRATLLKEPHAFFERLRDQLEADRETEPHSLHHLALASFNLGLLTDKIGDKQGALRAFKESLAITERLARQDPSNARRQSDLADCHYELGTLQHLTGRQAEGLASSERALAIRKWLVSQEPSVTEYRDKLARSHTHIGFMLSDTVHKSEALASYQQALTIWEPLARENPSVSKFQNSLENVLNHLGNAQRTMGKLAEALASYQRALAIAETLARQDPSNAEFQSDLARIHNNIGLVQNQTNQPAEAISSFERAIHIHQKLASENPSVTGYQDDLAKHHGNLGASQLSMGRLTEALASNERGLAIWERLARENPTYTPFQTTLASSHSRIGQTLLRMGRQVEAQASYRRALGIWERLAVENPSVTIFQRELAASHYQIGSVKSEAGRPAEALASYVRALGLWERLAFENPSVTEFQLAMGRVHVEIALMQLNMGRPTEALASNERALEIWGRQARKDPMDDGLQEDLAASYSRIGILQAGIGKRAEALESYERALAIQERLVRQHPESPGPASGLGGTLHNMARIDLDEQRWDEARARLVRAVEWQRKALAAEPRHPVYRQFLGNHLKSLIRAAEGKGNADQAAQVRPELFEWFKAELLELRRASLTIDQANKKPVAMVLDLWKKDPDLATIRDPPLLDKLPEAERKEWQALWSEVDALRARIQPR